MKIKNAGEVIDQLRALLPTYLRDSELIFKSQSNRENFQCPNHNEHEKGKNDTRPSCGFIPDSDNERFHCFTCGICGDIFTAVKCLEGKDITGANFYNVVKELAHRYNIKYETEEPTEDERRFMLAQKFLTTIISQSNIYLLQKKPKKVINYLKKREWNTLAEDYKFGYLPASSQVKDFFIKTFTKHPVLKEMISISDELITDRLIIPVLSQHGTILGLITREINNGDKRGKYRKHFLKVLKNDGILFNLKKDMSSAYIVEGSSSVLTMENYGIDNSVAVLGSSFTEDMYNKLIKHGVYEITLCFDGDNAGQKCYDKAITIVQNKPDIKVYIKKLPEELDPDDYIRQYGKEAFEKLNRISLFKYQLFRLREDMENISLKHSVYSLILSCDDNIIQERMFKLFIKTLKTQKTALMAELKKFEMLGKSMNDFTVTEMLEEKDSLTTHIGKFEETAWRGDKLLGVSTGFNILDDKLDGIQSGLHEIGGTWNVGKSAFLLSIALNMLKNPDVHVLYFSIDDPILTKTIPRALANLSMIPINTAANPYYRIQKNETLKEIERIELTQKREKALDLLRNLSTRFSLKDASDGYNLDFIEKMIKIRRLIAEDKKLVLFVDFLHMVSDGKNTDETALLTEVSRSFKRWSTLYNMPVITTVQSIKSSSTGTKMNDRDIKGSVSLQYDADTIMLLSSEFYSDPKTQMYFRDEDGEARPIVRVKITKNKISGYKGTLFYKFYPEYSLFKECEEEEMRKHRGGVER